ncbi:MAG TPA: SCO family protein [Bacteroidales bacterium]|jgi:protein SCO1/2|nr:SCO family protein [Bacteroidales bacterium]
MKKYITLLLITLFFTTHNISGQQPISSNILEIGWEEHLGDTIPLDLVFINDQSDTVTLRQLIDKPTVLSFVYFNCPGVCNPLQEGIAHVADKVDMELGKDYQILTISFDTTDSPEKAIKKKKNFVEHIIKDKAAYWIYLTGDQKNIDAITNAVGFRFKETGLDFAHPSGIILLSPEGKITRYLYGLDFLPFDLKLAIIEAQDGLAKPTINKVLQYCFNYNPQGQGYTLSITRITGIIIIFISLLVFISLLIGRGRSAKKQS